MRGPQFGKLLHAIASEQEIFLQGLPNAELPPRPRESLIVSDIFVTCDTTFDRESPQNFQWGVIDQKTRRPMGYRILSA